MTAVHFSLVQVGRSLWRRIVDQIWKTVVDVRVFRPDCGIETRGQAGLELLGRQTGDSRIVRWTACALAEIGDSAAACIPVRISVILYQVPTDKSSKLALSCGCA